MRRIRYLITLPVLAFLILAKTYPLRLVRVVDGDTIWGIVGEKTYKIRLIGIDTPEKRAGRHLYRQTLRTGKSQRELIRLAKEATRALSQLLSSCSKGLFLETDVQLYDRYGRLLGYVWCGNGRDRWMVNYAMVRLGYAMVYTFPPNVKYAELFARAQRKAREEKRGLWK